MLTVDWIDRWKGLLIVLVVAGHVVGGACHFSTGISRQILEVIYKGIYFFHMPAFFWLAGLCWHESREEFVSFAWRKAKRLLLPYFIFGFLSIILFLSLARGECAFSAASDSYYVGKQAGAFLQPFLSLIHGGGWPHGEGFRCNSVLWFLPTMFSVLCCFWCLDRLCKAIMLRLIVMFFLFALSFIVRSTECCCLPFGFSLVPWYLGFMLMGRILGALSPEDAAIERGWLWLTPAWIAFFLLAAIEPNCFLGDYRLHWYLIFLVMSVSGVVLSLRMAQALRARFWISLGKASLGIMLVHKFIILLFQVKVPYVARFGKSSVLMFWVANALVLILTVVLSWCASQVIRRIAPWALGEFRRK